MVAVIASVTALLLGCVLLMMGHSLLAIVVPLRLEAAAFPSELTGVIQAAYFGGLLAGSYFGQRFITGVGYIRSFAGFAAIMTAASLALPLFFDAAVWTVLRFIAGFCLAGLFMAMESWLNERSTNETRGQILGVYVWLTYFAMISGQLLINAWGSDGMEVFIVGGLLTALCLVPTAFTRISAPSLEAVEPLSPIALYKISPLAVIASAVAGLMQGAYWGFGAIFASRLGLDVFEVSLFTGALFIGGLIITWPVGKLSDKLDRRTVMLGVLVLTAISCAVGVPIAMGIGALPLYALLIVSALMGGLVATVYPTAMAQAFDYIPQSKYVAASGGLLLAYSVGATAGPLLMGVILAHVGLGAFFGYQTVLALGLALFVLYRMKVRPALPADEQEPYVDAILITPMFGSELDPRLEAGEDEEPDMAAPLRGEEEDSEDGEVVAA